MIHIGPENIESDTGRLLLSKTAKELGLRSGKYLFHDRHILYSKIRPYLNKVTLPSFSGICSADMYPLQSKSDDLIREFIFYFLLSEKFVSQAVSFQTRTGIPKINRQQLGSTLLPIPPKDEQQQISKILSVCDRKIQALEKEIALTDELFHAMLEQLMTGKISTQPLTETYV